MARPLLRRWLIRAGLLTLPTLLLLGGAELALRLAGYGFQPDFYIPVEKERGVRRANERYAWRFMPPEIARAPARERFAMPKPAGRMRVFILGSSAAMGYPSPAFSVGRMLEVMLRAAHPEREVEVINTAVTAINSHIVADIARECAGYEPDAFVVFTGNNEAIGPFGPAAAFSSFTSNPFLIRTSLWLSRWRLGQWMQSMVRGQAPLQWEGMEMFLRQELAADDARLDSMRANYRRNLESICQSGWKAGARVVLCTVPVNLRDCAPFASEEAVGRFALGRQAWEKGEASAAREHLSAARDLDSLRFRADSKMNAAVRALAFEEARPGFALADLEREFDRLAGGPPGAALFLEHVHLALAGNHAAARVILAALDPSAARQAPGLEQCRAALAHTAWDALAAASQVQELVTRAPFSERHENLRGLSREALARAGEQTRHPGAAEAARVSYEQALQARPDDPWLINNYAAFLAQTSNPVAEAEVRRRAIALRPEDNGAKLELARALWKTGHADEARQLCSAAEREMPRFPPLLKSLGDIYLANGELEEAVARFREALRLRPDYAAAMLTLGGLLQKQGQLVEAEGLLAQALALRDDAFGRLNLANLLMRQGRAPEALPHFQRAAALDPQNATLRSNCAAALFSAGRFEEAEVEFTAALTLDPRQFRAEFSLGQIHSRRGQWRQAEARFRRALQINASFFPAARELAWLLATAPDETIRRAEEALAIGEQLLRAAPDSTAVLDVAAASYANAGRFEKAADLASRAAEMAAKSGEATAADLRARAALYQAEKPYRAPDPAR